MSPSFLVFGCNVLNLFLLFCNSLDPDPADVVEARKGGVFHREQGMRKRQYHEEHEELDPWLSRGDTSNVFPIVREWCDEGCHFVGALRSIFDVLSFFGTSVRAP